MTRTATRTMTITEAAEALTACGDPRTLRPALHRRAYGAVAAYLGSLGFVESCTVATNRAADRSCFDFGTHYFLPDTTQQLWLNYKTVATLAICGERGMTDLRVITDAFN